MRCKDLGDTFDRRNTTHIQLFILRQTERKRLEDKYTASEIQGLAKEFLTNNLNFISVLYIQQILFGDYLLYF